MDPGIRVAAEPVTRSGLRIVHRSQPVTGGAKNACYYQPPTGQLTGVAKLRRLAQVTGNPQCHHESTVLHTALSWEHCLPQTLRAGTIVDAPRWERHVDGEPALGPGPDSQFSAVGVGDGLNDRQAQTVALAVGTATLARPHERFAQVGHVSLCHHRPGVADGHDGTSPAVRRTHGDVAAGDIVPDRVVDEVAHQNGDEPAVAEDRARHAHRLNLHPAATPLRDGSGPPRATAERSKRSGLSTPRSLRASVRSALMSCSCCPPSSRTCSRSPATKRPTHRGRPGRPGAAPAPPSVVSGARARRWPRTGVASRRTLPVGRKGRRGWRRAPAARRQGLAIASRRCRLLAEISLPWP